MGLILRDFKCDKCRSVFEALVLPNATIAGHTCGGQGNKILTFKGIVRVAPDSTLPPILARDKGLTREVSPGRDLTPHFEEEREHSKIRWVEKKLPDGRVVRRPSVKLDEPKSRGLNSNLEMDAKRAALKKRG